LALQVRNAAGRRHCSNWPAALPAKLLAEIGPLERCWADVQLTRA
jgi:hypothetical protein